MKVIILSLFYLIFANSINAQWNQNMRMGQWNITIEANQFTAKTIMEMQFCNDINKGDAEAFYSFFLKPNQAVTHFELMLGDKYRDGSIEERWKAVSTYNSIVGKRVDPAVLQKNYGNHYTLNVYPVSPNSCRKVRITIEQKLTTKDNKLIYSLPIASAKEISKLAVSFTTNNTILPIEKGILKTKKEQSGKIFFSDQFKNINDSIYIEMPINKKSICIENNENMHYLAYRNTIDFETERPIQPKNVALYFDVSMANSNNDINLNFDFLKSYFEQNNILNFTVIAFNQEVVFEQYLNIATLNNLKYKLRNWKFTGASNLNVVVNTEKKYDAILLFSKGTSAYANIANKQIHTPIFAIVKEKEVYEIDNLKKIISGNGGKIISIQKGKMKEAATQMQTIKSFIKQLYINNQLTSFQLLDTIQNTQTVMFAESSEPIKTVKIVFTNSIGDEAVTISSKEFCYAKNLDKMEILQKYEDLEKNRNNTYQYYNHYDNYWTKALSFGRKNKIVTEQTAYLVLERIEDYINYGITPPKEIEQQVINDPRYVKRVEKDPVMWDVANRTKQNLAVCINYYNSYLKKHGDAKYKSLSEIALDKVKLEAITSSYAGNDERRGNSFNSNINNTPTFSMSATSMKSEEVVVTSFEVSNRKQMSSSVTKISAKDIQSTSPLDLASSLAGRVSGVQVLRQNNDMGYNNVGLMIRGSSSLNGNSNALIVVDGFAYGDSYNLSNININDIESVTVLKDISATALFGSKAANGAIVIQTKQAKYNTRPIWKKYNLNDMEDVDYMNALRNVKRAEMWDMYEELKKDFGHKVNFYVDAAQIFSGSYLKKEAKDILLSALEIAQSNVDKLYIGFALDDLSMHSEARKVYTNITNTINEWTNYQRCIAISYLQENKIQDAANAYYKSLVEQNVQYPYDNPTLVLEFSALLNAYKGKIDTSQYEIVFSNPNLPSKHVAVESPNGNSQYISLKNTESNGYENYNYYNRIASYNFSKLNQKTSELSVKCYNYYGDYLNFVRVVEFENFGTEAQKLTIKTHNLTGQYGDVVVQNIKN